MASKTTDTKPGGATSENTQTWAAVVVAVLGGVTAETDTVKIACLAAITVLIVSYQWARTKAKQ